MKSNKFGILILMLLMTGCDFFKKTDDIDKPNVTLSSSKIIEINGFTEIDDSGLKLEVIEVKELGTEKFSTEPIYDVLILHRSGKKVPVKKLSFLTQGLAASCKDSSNCDVPTFKYFTIYYNSSEAIAKILLMKGDKVLSETTVK